MRAHMTALARDVDVIVILAVFWANRLRGWIRRYISFFATDSAVEIWDALGNALAEEIDIQQAPFGGFAVWPESNRLSIHDYGETRSDFLNVSVHAVNPA